ncbi:MAG: peptide chain release factor 1 [Olpidium bornovanus]|uniref:Peptide chain release factor 1 n=1 Tax=Olpidium bornovanus TaxID=278681 RepID=A0A8H7ZWJ3_9FUNG|nr:MAG: peptide chain release factor 1 [Olpidium bornovanus]
MVNCRLIGQHRRHVSVLCSIFFQLASPPFSSYRSKSLVEIEKMMSDTRTDDEMYDLAREEKNELLSRVDDAEKAVVKAMLPRDPKDDGNAIMEIRPGTGGNEANLFAADLMRMYQRFALNVGWRFEPLVTDVDGHGGLKVKCLCSVQRVPLTEEQGRLHTSAACVVVMPERVDDVPQIRKSDLVIDTMRSSGKGGQHVNTTDSAVRVVHVPTGISVVVMDERSQHYNKAKALEIVSARVAHLTRAKSDALHAATKKSLQGTGERSDKIRTYNFPQDRVTDHRVGLSKFGIDRMMEGELLAEVINALRMDAETNAMAEWQ